MNLKVFLNVTQCDTDSQQVAPILLANVGRDRLQLPL